MFDRFTDRARKAMGLARQESQRFNHDYIGTEHILLGLVQEGSGVAASVLKNLDIDLKKVRLEVEKLVIQPGQTFELHVPLPAELGRRRVLNVRFRAEDFVYRGSDLRQCVVFQLERVALE